MDQLVTSSPPGNRAALLAVLLTSAGEDGAVSEALAPALQVRCFSSLNAIPEIFLIQSALLEC
jgi:hypothetical protein